MEIETKSLIADKLEKVVETDVKEAVVTKKKRAPKVIKSAKDLEFERDHKLVKGKLRYHESPGGIAKFSYVKYKGDSAVPYELTDGEICEIPYMVAKHLNENCRYPVHKHAVDAEGRPSRKIGRWIDRMNFEPIGFFDDLGEKPDLITVENI